MSTLKFNNIAALPWRGLALPLLLLLVWEIVLKAGIANPVFLPTIGAVVDTGTTLVMNGELWIGLKASLYRDLVGLSIGSLLGISIGIALGVSRLADRLFLPTLDTLKQISPFALIPLMSFWFGLDEPAKIVFIVITCIFPILLNTYEGVRSVPVEFIEVGRVYRFGPLQQLWRVILPAASPSIFTGLHMGVFFSWLGTVGAEYFFKAGPGIGNTIVDGRNTSRPDLVFFGVIVIGLTGYLLNRVLGLIEKRVLRWRIERQ